MSESEKISFNQLNRQTGHRIKYLKIDADTGDEVPNEEIVKGYQLKKDQLIEVTMEELEEIALESTRTVEIDEFVEKAEGRERRRSNGGPAQERRWRRRGDRGSEKICQEGEEGVRRPEGNADAYSREEGGEGVRSEEPSGGRAAEVGGNLWVSMTLASANVGGLHGCA
jgi:Ku70/Ku80 beta-barrel domain